MRNNPRGDDPAAKPLPFLSPQDRNDYDALLQFLYLAPVGLVQMNSAGEILMLNPLSSQILMPLTRDGELSNFFTALADVAPDLRHQVAAFRPAHGMVCDAVRVLLGPADVQKSDRKTISITLLKLDHDRLMGVLFDVTEQVRRERLLRQNEAWLNAILTDIHDYALVSLDLDGKVDDWNDSIGRVTGFTREQIVGEPYAIFYPEGSASADRMLDLLRDASDNGWSLDDGWRVRADGTRVWGSTMISPLGQRERLTAGRPDLRTLPAVRQPGRVGESGYCLVIRDISDKREASEDYRKAYSCDHLTGIANRRTFFEAAEIELARARRSQRELSLILIDADHFKRINDSHGHPVGDIVLQHLASRLTETFRGVDLVARVGGEEFAVLLPSTDIEHAFISAERLRQAVQSQPVVVDGRSISYTVSAGVASGTGASLVLDELIKRADAALYQAKAAGRDRVTRADAAD